MVSGPRRPGDPDGPDEFVVVIVDNGRSRVMASDSSEILACIRCGACLNVCPVFREVGGHTYDHVYQGPVGAVLAPGLADFADHVDLPFASSLCGACREVCPVRIDIPKLLVNQRVHATRENDPFRWMGPGLAFYAQAAKRTGRLEDRPLGRPDGRTLEGRRQVVPPPALPRQGMDPEPGFPRSGQAVFPASGGREPRWNVAGSSGGSKRRWAPAPFPAFPHPTPAQHSPTWPRLT